MQDIFRTLNRYLSHHLYQEWDRNVSYNREYSAEKPTQLSFNYALHLRHHVIRRQMRIMLSTGDVEIACINEQYVFQLFLISKYDLMLIVEPSVDMRIKNFHLIFSISISSTIRSLLQHLFIDNCLSDISMNRRSLIEQHIIYPLMFRQFSCKLLYQHANNRTLRSYVTLRLMIIIVTNHLSNSSDFMVNGNC